MADPQRTQLTLLKVAVALLAAQLLLTAAVVFGGALLIGRLSAAADGPVQALREDLATTQQLARDLTARQASIAAGLDAVAVETAKDVRALKERRAALSPIQRGPVDKIDQVIALMQLLSDELMLVLDHVAKSQGVVAKHTRPSGSQRELVRPDGPDAGVLPGK